MTASIRSVLAAVVLVIAVIAVPASAAAWWTRDVVTDTDSFVDTLAPLAEEPEVQALVEEQLVSQVMTFVAAQDLPGKAVAGLDELGLPPRLSESLVPLLADPLRDRLETSVTDLSHRIVQSPEFAEAWEDSLRSLHAQLADVLEDPAAADRMIAAQEGQLNLRLATLTESVKLALQQAGIPGADLLPTVDVTVPIADVEQVATMQRGYDLIDRWGRLLPLITLVLLVAGIALARHHARATRWTALGTAGMLALTLIGIAVGRSVAVGALPPDSAAAGEAGIQLLTADLRGLIRSLIVLSLVIAVASLFLGRSDGARGRRRQVRQGYDAVRTLTLRYPYGKYVAAAIALVCLVLLLSLDLGLWMLLLVLAVGVLAGWLTVIAFRESPPDFGSLVSSPSPVDEGPERAEAAAPLDATQPITGDRPSDPRE